MHIPVRQSHRSGPVSCEPCYRKDRQSRYGFNSNQRLMPRKPLDMGRIIPFGTCEIDAVGPSKWFSANTRESRGDRGSMSSGPWNKCWHRIGEETNGTHYPEPWLPFAGHMALSDRTSGSLWSEYSIAYTKYCCRPFYYFFKRIL